MAHLRPLFVTLFVLLPAIAFADVKLEILETHPESPAAFANWGRYSLHLRYETDRTIWIQLDGYLGGKRVNALTGGVANRNAGTGEAALWIAFTERARVDRIVLWAMDRAGESVARVERSVDLTWTGIASTESRQDPAWLTQLDAEQERRQQAAYDAVMNGPLMWIGSVLVSGLGLSVPLYFIVQIVSLIRLRDRWRRLAVVPAVPMGLVLVYTIFAFSQGSNLFPLVLLFTSPLALMYLLALLAARRFRGRTASGAAALPPAQ